MISKPRELYEPDVYMKISYDELVTYALFSLLKTNKNPTFENLVEKVFTLFPSRFHLIGHPEWPDSSLVNKTWLRCRTDKHYITGSTSRGFNITPLGTRAAERIHNKLAPSSGDVVIVRRKGDERTRAGIFVKRIEKSKAYHLYKVGKRDQIQPLDFYELIFCTPDSLPLTKKDNLIEIKQYVELYGRDDIMNLLHFC